MPNIEYKCQQCNQTFCRVTLQGEPDRRQKCPKCHVFAVKPTAQPARLFDGISNFSTLAKDTN